MSDGFKYIDVDIINDIVRIWTDFQKIPLDVYGYGNLGETVNTAKYTNYLIQLKEENASPTDESIVESISKYWPLGTGGAWANAVMQMGAWYQENIHDYNQGAMTDCDLINKKVRHDCSGFTTACLWLMGGFDDLTYPPTSGAFTDESSQVGQLLSSAGFTGMEFTSFEDCQPFDIISLKGHVEIFYKMEDNKPQSYGWGACHDGLNGHYGMPHPTCKSKYTHIWRPSAEMAAEGTIDMMATGEIAGAGWGFVSKNLISMMVGACEGWSDARAKLFLGKPGTDAQAGCQSKIDRSSVITVGPGLTNALNGMLPAGLKITNGKIFTAKQIMQMYSLTIRNACNDILKKNPSLKNMSQGVKDAAVDCYHSGVRFWINSGWPNVRTPEQAAAACQKMPKTAKGVVNEQLTARRNAESAICLGKACTSGKAKIMTDAYYHPIANIINLL